MKKECKECKLDVEIWNKRCKECGFTLVLEPNENKKARFLKGPSLGALLFTQGWTFGARVYVWFLLSLVPVVGFVALFACLFFGRRWSWKYGGWDNWDQFKNRMRVLDAIGLIWVTILVIIYFAAKK